MQSKTALQSFVPFLRRSVKRVGPNRREYCPDSVGEFFW